MKSLRSISEKVNKIRARRTHQINLFLVTVSIAAHGKAGKAFVATFGVQL
jgi:hypothetical protein